MSTTIARLALPGRLTGPCVTQTCEHPSCGDMRKVACMLCSTCVEAIGYGREFMIDDDDETSIQHTDCFLIHILEYDSDLVIRALDLDNKARRLAGQMQQ